ncbi:MAG TPA: hypothetical protein VGE20_05460, partial [Ramlibacter sp.]
MLQRTITFGDTCDDQLARAARRLAAACLAWPGRTDSSEQTAREPPMSPADFRVESNHPITGRLWPAAGSQQY